jgi:ribose transport system ATP-binding protein
VRALAGVDLEVRPAEVHALLGENGAGKSTLIKVLAGVLAADAGSVEVGGGELPRNFTPRDAAAAGLRFVHQDFGLIDTMSVLENIALVAGFPKRGGLIDYRASAAQAHERLAGPCPRHSADGHCRRPSARRKSHYRTGARDGGKRSRHRA